VLDHDGYLPCYAVMTDGKESEMKVAKSMTFQPGTMLVFDRGYPDHDWWLSLTRCKVDFVTRLKERQRFLRGGLRTRSTQRRQYHPGRGHSLD
jgi:hypothetical protein